MISDSTPPRLTATIGMVTRFRKRSAASTPPSSSKLSMPPKPPKSSRARSCPGFVGRPGIVDPGHGGQVIQEPGDLEGAGVLLPDAKGYGLDAAVQQKAGMRIERAAEVVRQEA